MVSFLTMIPLEELEVYKVALEIGDFAWNLVDKWPFFAKDTLGKQLVKAADSMAFNIAEGHGRYFYKENRNFCFYSRGSAKEALTGFRKAEKRHLLSPEESDHVQKRIAFYFILMAGYIRSIGRNKDE